MIKPSLETFAMLLKALPFTDSYDGADTGSTQSIMIFYIFLAKQRLLAVHCALQRFVCPSGFLNTLFPTWFAGCKCAVCEGGTGRLSFGYNAQRTMRKYWRLTYLKSCFPSFHAQLGKITWQTRAIVVCPLYVLNRMANEL